MRRSFIDRRIEAMLEFCDVCRFKLPPFALWGEAQYRAQTAAARRIGDAGLGWNVVEFKPGAYRELGLTIFTSRMGDWRALSSGGGRLYAEKTMLAEDGQRTPHHFHVVKTEDILNRGGARFIVELFKVDSRGIRLDERLQVLKDAEMLDLAAGARVSLEPGESLTLPPFVAHSFWAEGGGVLAGEISLANDDATDNYFLPPVGSLAPIVEDAPMRYVTVRDHEKLLRGDR
jgi:D-lyxose ketol-isomerase